MRILVTGASGFIGGALIRRLVSQGQTPRVLLRRPAFADGDRTEALRGDLCDAECLRRAIGGVDVVYHCAAMVHASGSEREFLRCNFGGTQRVLQISREMGVRRVIYISSLGIYGRCASKTIDEYSPADSHPELRGPYAYSKILADYFAREFAVASGLPLVIFRPGLVYGPGRRLPIALFGMEKGRIRLIIGSTAALLPVNYVENLVDALLMAGDLARNVSGAFNIIDDEHLTLGAFHAARTAAEGGRTIFIPGWPLKLTFPLFQWFAHVARVNRVDGICHQVRRALHSIRYSTKKVRNELGWKPRVASAEAIRLSLAAPESAVAAGCVRT